MRIAIIGYTGMLGNDLFTYLTAKQQEVLGLSHEDIEVTVPSSFEVMDDFKPEIIINTSQCNVEDSEADPKRALEINAGGAGNVAKYAQKSGASVIHFSTNYVFDGSKNIYLNEDEKPSPINMYGVSKLAGEYMVKNYCEKHFIIRTCGLYSKIQTRKGPSHIHDVILAGKDKSIDAAGNYYFSPTWTLQVCKGLVHLFDAGEYGLYHMTSTGDCSYYDFVSLIVEELRLPVEVVKVDIELVNTPPRSLLHNKNLEVVGLNKMDFWNSALKRCLLNFEVA